ncbi:MAG: hypothetical protein JWQ35_231 [Bacteriovoracaceae bacterium]|nr:hypothetical protein [Bacteriovoracaceae bacterium]
MLDSENSGIFCRDTRVAEKAIEYKKRGVEKRMSIRCSRIAHLHSRIWTLGYPDLGLELDGQNRKPSEFYTDRPGNLSLSRIESGF